MRIREVNRARLEFQDDGYKLYVTIYFSNSLFKASFFLLAQIKCVRNY
jgi:hypothetical protein